MNNFKISPLSALLGALIAVGVLLFTGAGSGSSNQVGTYEMLIRDNWIYVLDTRNSDLWKAEALGHEFDEFQLKAKMPKQR